MPPEEKKAYGLLASGIVMTKNRYPGKNGNPDRFGVDVAIPGCREMISIQLPPEKWGSITEQSDYKNLVTFRKYNGAIYFEEVQK